MFILLPDHSAAISGTPGLLQAFAEKNHLAWRIYPLAEFRTALKNRDLSWLKRQSDGQKISLFFVPTTVRIDEDLLTFCDGLVQAFATPSTGTDHVDLSLLESRGIPFHSGPGENATAVVEYVLSALPHFFEIDRLLSGDLSIGIVGFGRIGGLLGRVCQRMGFFVTAYDPFVLGSTAKDRDRVLASDVVTYHLPLTTEGGHPTAGMINQEWIEMSRPGTVWMNTGRGQIFDPRRPDLFVESLARFRTLYDVFPVEPPPAEWIERTTIPTPHVAGYTWRGRFMGVFRVFSDFAAATGRHMPFQPSDFRPPRFDLNGPAFLEIEAQVLKNNPQSFSPRRNAYPSRSSFRDDQEMGVEWSDSHYYRRIYQIWDEMRL